MRVENVPRTGRTDRNVYGVTKCIIIVTGSVGSPINSLFLPFSPLHSATPLCIIHVLDFLVVLLLPEQISLDLLHFTHTVFFLIKRISQLQLLGSRGQKITVYLASAIQKFVYPTISRD